MEKMEHYLKQLTLSTFVLLSFIVLKYRSTMFLHFWEDRLTARICRHLSFCLKTLIMFIMLENMVTLL